MMLVSDAARKLYLSQPMTSAAAPAFDKIKRIQAELGVVPDSREAFNNLLQSAGQPGI